MTAVSGEAVRRYLKVAERQPMQAILSTDWRHRPPMLKRYPRQDAVAPPEVLSRLLSESYGLTRYRWDSVGLLIGRWHGGMPAAGRTHRPVPSGGGLYPCELYVVRPDAVLHYDPAAHALDPVRHGDFRFPDAPEAWFSIVVTSVFARVAFKYQEFGFRLQCLDAGVLAGQLLTVIEAAGLHGRMRLVFHDEAVAATVGVDPDRETPLAVIDIAPKVPHPKVPHPKIPGSKIREVARQSTSGAAPDTWIARQIPGSWSAGPASAEPAASARPAAAEPTERTRPEAVLDSVPLTRDLYYAARSQTDAAWPPAPATSTEPGIKLPEVEIPPLSAAKRRSLDGRFGTDPIAMADLAAVLAAAYRWPAGRSAGAGLEHLVPLCVVHRVDGLERGLYRYRPATHDLVPLRRADMRIAMAPPDPANARLLGDHGAGAVLVPVGDYERGLEAAGNRWFQMQNIPAGISIQRATLAGAALGLGCRVSCAFDVDHLAGVLGLEGGPLRPLCQVLIGSTGTDVGYDQPL